MIHCRSHFAEASIWTLPILGMPDQITLLRNGVAECAITAPATDAAKQWDGWGTALKPAYEPIILARKPLEGTVAANVIKHGVGGINIDGCRVETDDDLNGGAYAENGGRTESQSMRVGSGMNQAGKTTGTAFQQPKGRWPANFLHDGDQAVMDLFPDSKGQQGDLVGHSKDRESPNGCFGKMAPAVDHAKRGDSGSAARFFYTAKTSKADRNEGCEDLDDKEWRAEGACIPERGDRPFLPSKNNHPTVKPTTLMQYLCRLITPPGGIILDPFMGSGSTGKAAVREGFRFIGIEQDAKYFAIAEQRIYKFPEWLK